MAVVAVSVSSNITWAKVGVHEPSLVVQIVPRVNYTAFKTCRTSGTAAAITYNAGGSQGITISRLNVRAEAVTAVPPGVLGVITIS